MKPNEPIPVLVWTDLETTGLDPDHHSILETAAIATAADLSGGDEPDRFHTVVWWNGNPATLPSAVRNMHTDNGLLEEATALDAPTLWDADEAMAAWLDDVAARHAAERLTLAGSSAHFDMGFITKHMPQTRERLHYRVFDVSTLLQAFQWWADDDLGRSQFPDEAAHRAEQDISTSLTLCRAAHAVVLRASSGGSHGPHLRLGS